MKTNKYFFVIIISLIVYFVSDFFFNDAILYLTGGSIAAILGLFLGLFNYDSSFSSVAFVWLLLLIAFIKMFYKVQKFFLVSVIVFFIGALLYILDLVLYEALQDITGRDARYLNIGIRIVTKSAMLSLIVYFKNNSLRKKQSNLQ